MGREILFRGKRVIDGKWVESRCPLGEMHSGTVTYDFVSETVCQYTGLNDGTKWEELSEEEKEKFLSELNHREDRMNTKEDWNGRKIFEGDIVDRKVKFPEIVVFHDGDWTLDYSYASGKESGYNYCNLGFYTKERGGVKIIGNIFDNPELLNQ